MTPTQFYVIRASVNKTQAARDTTGKKVTSFKNAFHGSGPKYFYWGPLFTNANATISPGVMNELDVPTNEEIAKQQLDWIHSNMHIDSAIQQFLDIWKSLFQNGGLNNIYFDNSGVSVGNAVTLIEKVLGKTSFTVGGNANTVQSEVSPYRHLLTSAQGTISFRDNIQSYRELDSALTSILNIVTNIQNGAMVADTNIKGLIQKLQQASTSLKQDLTNYDNGKNVIGGNYISDGTLWQAYAQIKGRFLEIAFQVWLSAHLPQGIRVVDTSKLRDENKQVIRSGADIGLINIAANINNPGLGVKCNIDGQELSFNDILEFFNYLEKNNGKITTVVIEQGQWEQMMGRMTGVNVKSGYGQSIVNKNTVGNAVSIDDLINQRNNYYIQALRIFNMWYNFNNAHHIYAIKPDVYNAYFDYSLSHILLNVLGKNNSIVGTRYGLMSLKDYVEQEWRDRKAYFHAVGNISIASTATKYQLIFSGKSHY